MGGGTEVLQNLNPRLFVKCGDRTVTDDDWNENVTDEFDSREVFDLIRHINDPEHPLTLEELNVVDVNRITVDNEKNKIDILYTPTIPHCSLATLIGLTIKVQLLRNIPPRFKIQVKITPGTHVSEAAINKQMADKERVSAAMENIDLIQTINKSLVEVESHYK
uniref:Mitotic spindle-associated MMXD complex subunit MIP18 n=1 Tax=Lygus hesperus TaxID=30085 RepID=A0A0A9WFJ8_LYGHE